MPASPARRKPRAKPKPYVRKKQRQASQRDAPKTSALPPSTTKRENLTLHDWLTVLVFVDDHPAMSQIAIREYFASLPNGALSFSQSALSRKIKEREKLETRANDNPNAMSSKRPRVVTRPDVERALYLWVKHMEAKRETVNGPMLREKRKRFETQLGVPDDERIVGDGWVASFCRAYKIKEFRRHGEADSVDLQAVERERHRMNALLKTYELKDMFNVDETALLPFAPPDRGLATKQMSGKKKEKFRITLAFTVNADGSERLPPFYIGKAKKPRCFKKQGPTERGFYYRNNKKAWMTAELFEEFIRSLDVKMRKENRHICLLLDNFSGHFIDYQPRNIRLEYFEPNLTSHVQPLDAGIIRCFKAFYRRAFCKRAIDLDEAGEREIYSINILEGILMAKEAWEAVDIDTIKHCWAHTGILPKGGTSTDADSLDSPRLDHGAWSILREFAVSSMTLPDAESRLLEHLGDSYNDKDWRPALKAVMAAEGDVGKAQEAIETLASKSHLPRLTIKLPARAAQLQVVEAALMDSINDLVQRKRIFGDIPTLEELIDPIEESQDADSDSAYLFEGGDNEIIQMVQHEISEKNIIEVEDSDEEEEDPEDDCSITELITLCERLERQALKHGDVNFSMDLPGQLRRFRGQLRRKQIKNSTQPRIDKFFTK